MDNQTKKALAKLIILNAEAISDLAKAFLDAADKLDGLKPVTVNFGTLDKLRYR